MVLALRTSRSGQSCLLTSWQTQPEQFKSMGPWRVRDAGDMDMAAVEVLKVKLCKRLYRETKEGRCNIRQWQFCGLCVIKLAGRGRDAAEEIKPGGTTFLIKHQYWKWLRSRSESTFPRNGPMYMYFSPDAYPPRCQCCLLTLSRGERARGGEMKFRRPQIPISGPLAECRCSWQCIPFFFPLSQSQEVSTTTELVGAYEWLLWNMTLCIPMFFQEERKTGGRRRRHSHSHPAWSSSSWWWWWEEDGSTFRLHDDVYPTISALPALAFCILPLSLSLPVTYFRTHSAAALCSLCAQKPA